MQKKKSLELPMGSTILEDSNAEYIRGGAQKYFQELRDWIVKNFFPKNLNSN